MPPRSLEDLVIWQVAREIAAEVYRQTAGESFARDPSLRDEVRTAGRVVMLAIAAAYEAQNERALARGFDRAAQAAADLSSLLYLTTDLRLLDRSSTAALQARAHELTRLIRGWQRAIRAHQHAVKLTASRLN
jgi:four helix bundle protein